MARGGQEMDGRRAEGFLGAGGREGVGGGGGVVEGGAGAEDTPTNNVSSRTRSRKNCE